MWWKAILKLAVMLGADEWAERKLLALAEKGLDRLRKKANKAAEGAKLTPKAVEALQAIEVAHSAVVEAAK